METSTTTIRIDSVLMDEAKRIADAERRSLNQQIVKWIADGIAAANRKEGK